MWELCVGLGLITLLGSGGEPRSAPRGSVAPTILDDRTYRKELLKYLPAGTPLGVAKERLELFGFSDRGRTFQGISLHANPGPTGLQFVKTFQSGPVVCWITVVLVNDSRAVTDIVVSTVLASLDASHYYPDMVLP